MTWVEGWADHQQKNWEEFQVAYHHPGGWFVAEETLEAQTLWAGIVEGTMNSDYSCLFSNSYSTILCDTSIYKLCKIQNTFIKKAT